jgi:hypothetical protein
LDTVTFCVPLAEPTFVDPNDKPDGAADNVAEPPPVVPPNTSNSDAWPPVAPVLPVKLNRT